MKYPEVGDKVSFRLDNKWEGTGVVVPSAQPLPSKAFEVKIDTPVKEYPSGEIIVVWLEEVTTCSA